MRNLSSNKYRPSIANVLSSWEMSTIGHPLSDLANVLHPWAVLDISADATQKLQLISPHHSQLTGLPSILECLSWYQLVAGWSPEPEITWANAFALFRMSVVRQGITARYAARQTSSSNALNIGRGMFICAQLAQALIDKMMNTQMGNLHRL